jgi:hypothetical protein
MGPLALKWKYRLLTGDHNAKLTTIFLPVFLHENACYKIVFLKKCGKLILMDIGESLNPAIDIGQIEGAYMQML